MVGGWVVGWMGGCPLLLYSLTSPIHLYPLSTIHHPLSTPSYGFFTSCAVAGLQIRSLAKARSEICPIVPRTVLPSGRVTMPWAS